MPFLPLPDQTLRLLDTAGAFLRLIPVDEANRLVREQRAIRLGSRRRNRQVQLVKPIQTASEKTDSERYATRRQMRGIPFTDPDGALGCGRRSPGCGPAYQEPYWL